MNYGVETLGDAYRSIADLKGFGSAHDDADVMHLPIVGQRDRSGARANCRRARPRVTPRCTA